MVLLGTSLRPYGDYRMKVLGHNVAPDPFPGVVAFVHGSDGVESQQQPVQIVCREVILMPLVVCCISSLEGKWLLLTSVRACVGNQDHLPASAQTRKARIDR